MSTNYQLLLDDIIRRNGEEGKVPTLLLHSCCAPCSSYTLEYLSQYFDITVFYYNPNIEPADEYLRRVEEQQRLLAIMPFKNKVEFVNGKYDPSVFHSAVAGLENEPEGGLRCFECYRLRLRAAAREAAARGLDYFCTTLSISPLKRASIINTIGEEEGHAAGVAFLPSDFKKRGGYLRSVVLSRQYGLYRQNFCGCIYSRRTKEPTQ